MKINEVIQPSAKTQAKMLAESWSSDSDSPFSESQHQVIAESVVRSESAHWSKFETIDSLMEWLDKSTK